MAAPISLSAICLVFAGGGTGAVLRFLLGHVMLRAMGPGYPWGTLIANLGGGLAMGVLVGVLARHGGNEPARLLLAVGLLGGFTTFSAFSLDIFNMMERGQAGLALGYAALSTIGAVAALALGLLAVRNWA